jgi:hypothetical protein
LAIGVVSLAELHVGVLVAASDDDRSLRPRRLSIVQRRFDPLPVDQAVAERYGMLAARVVTLGDLVSIERAEGLRALGVRIVLSDRARGGDHADRGSGGPDSAEEWRAL